MGNIRDDMRRATMNENIEICDRVKAVPKSEVSSRHPLSLELAEKYTHIPEALMNWGERLLESGDKKFGAHFIDAAIDHAEHDKKPSIIFNSSQRILGKHSLFQAQESVFQKACEAFPEDNKFFAQYAQFLLQQKRPDDAIILLNDLHQDENRGNDVTASIFGNAYIHARRPEEGITFLESWINSDRGDDFTASTLGNAYIHARRPEEGIAFLKSWINSDRGDNVTANILGKALVATQNRKKFDAHKNNITPETMRDYLDAKLHFLEGAPQKAMKILTPQIQENLRMNTASLFMACLEEDSPWHGILQQSLGQNTYDYISDHIAEWKDNPQRAILDDLEISNGHDLFELGGLPISHAEREKTSTDFLPVGSSNHFWRKENDCPSQG
ncbi:MAG: tetratricopeptide repeat protein [Alphaproteobacteria bacterium]